MESNELLQIQPISEMPIARYPNMNSSQNTPSASLISLGCSKNTVDSEIMLASLSSYGFKLEPEFNKAEIVIINTCGFIEEAKHESIDTILSIGELKKEGTVKIIVVAGCLVERYKTELTKELPEVDLFIGTREYDLLPKLLLPKIKKEDSSIEYYSDTLMDYNRRLPRILSDPGPSAYIKIAEGCSRPCTFCVIPRFRGKFRSRPLEIVLDEAKALGEIGVKEINLLAQEITSYGTDLEIGWSLAKLLEKLNEIKNIEWIRVLYNYPRGVTDELLDTFRLLPKVCEYIDMPLQHISTKILNSMRRGIDEIGTRKLIDRIKEKIPDCAIRTTMLVGYPGETDKDFELLLNFVEETRFARLGAFVFSPEERSIAAKLPNQTPYEVAKERTNELLTLQKRIMEEENKKLIGTKTSVLIERLSEEGLLQGRTRFQAPEVDGDVYLNKTEGIPGEIISGKIVKTDGINLVIEKN
jgi:ribosomal protein S12 methylthiotransferase